MKNGTQNGVESNLMDPCSGNFEGFPENNALKFGLVSFMTPVSFPIPTKKHLRGAGWYDLILWDRSFSKKKVVGIRYFDTFVWVSIGQISRVYARFVEVADGFLDSQNLCGGWGAHTEPPKKDGSNIKHQTCGCRLCTLPKIMMKPDIAS